MSVGVSVVDTDHKLLVKLLNQLSDSVEELEERSTLGSVLNTLVDYTKYHFEREEKVMEACCYPGLPDHIGQHAALAGKVLDVQGTFLDDPECVIGADILDFLKDWLTTHILKQDMAFRPYAEGNLSAARAASTVPSIQQSVLEHGNSFDWENLKVLIVDDNVNFRRVVRTILKAAEVAAVREAESVMDALGALDKFTPDVILCDWLMDGADGVEFARQFRGDGLDQDGEIPIIMVTGFGNEDFRQRARNAGIENFMEKPITPKDLLIAIRDAAKRPGPEGN